jgi:hypothetical protein
MKRRTSNAAALALLAVGLLVGVSAILYQRWSRPVVQEVPQEVPAAPSTPLSEAELDAEISKMIAESREEGRRSQEASEQRMDEEFGPQLWKLGRTRLIAFIGVADRGPDGKPRMTETWKGRRPSDFASYIEPLGPGPWLIGRLRKGAGPLERSLSPQLPLRFCYEITPEGEVVGVKEEGWVKLEELRKHIEGK